MERTKFGIVIGVLLTSLALLSLSVHAEIINVPDDFQTINPVCFTENRGQWDERVLFKADGYGGLTWWLERDGFTLLYSIPDMSAKPLDDPRDLGLPENFPGREPKVYPRKGHALKFRFVQRLSPLLLKGGTEGGLSESCWRYSSELPAPAREVIPYNRLSWNNNYFLGNDPSKWAPDCGNFKRIVYRDIWEGIDVEWYGVNGLVEFDFIVHPNADPAQIGLRVDGLKDEMEVTADGGELLLPTTLGMLRLALPEAWSVGGLGQVSDVEAAFVLVGENKLGFELPDEYDANETLVIDPLVYSTYLGGSETDIAHAICLDGAGGVVVAGYTEGVNFPTTEGALDRSFNEYRDAFATRLSEDGSELIYSTYLGGGYFEHAPMP